MQTQCIVASFEPSYEVAFVLQNIQSQTPDINNLKMSAKNFRLLANCILKVVSDTIKHPDDNLSDQFDQAFAIDAANGFIEAADYLDSISSQEGN